jgi:PAS domain S-box-containing protein
MVTNIFEVRRALNRQEVVAYFQPLVELSTGRLTGFEVLARWLHPELGPILPKNFIGLVEEEGLAHLLMEQVLRDALRSSDLLPQEIGLSFNVSPTQFHDTSLPGAVRELAERASFPLDRLTVEITETSIFNDMAIAKAISYGLKEIGCKIALDDFGTGFSSLTYLQALPFDELKIDRSFVGAMTGTKESRKIVAAVVGLGLSLGIDTVAEGVETKEQAQKLIWLGCEKAQGWLYGRPAPAGQLAAIIAAPPITPTPQTVGLLGEETPVESLDAMPSLRLPQLQALYEGAPVGLCFLDTKFRYVSLNRKLAQMNGASIGSHLGRTVEQMIPLAFGAVEPYLKRAMQGEVILDVEISKPSGKAIWLDRTVLASYQPAWDESREVVGVSVASMDITERVRAEEALHESEDLHRHMFQINPQVPWIMDAEGNNLEVNARWAESTGESYEKVRGFSWIDNLHPEDRVYVQETMEESIRNGEPIDVRYRVKNGDGEWNWKRSRGAPRFGPDGAVLRWYGIVENLAVA